MLQNISMLIRVRRGQPEPVPATSLVVFQCVQPTLFDLALNVVGLLQPDRGVQAALLRTEDDEVVRLTVLTETDTAICWKTAQPKDEANLRGENSEDSLTWQFFRSIDALGLASMWASSLLGVEDMFRLYYWQRLRDQDSIDPHIDTCLAKLEPVHTQRNWQHTETDLILRGPEHARYDGGEARDRE
jgi:hypothetical protein